jgi:hypothetical protein
VDEMIVVVGLTNWPAIAAVEGFFMPQDTWRQIGPVLLSILVILVVAVLRTYSRTVAAITATMPVIIPLSLWIIWSSTGGDRATVQQYTGTLLAGILGTLGFILALWLTARAGWRLPSMLAVSYLVWAATVGLILAVRRLMGG